ncbi:peptidase M55 D-aminopeptidase [Catenulispora acidiphila DSM 44928]|uniref:Peptidase M55 D-aminopeptidase n=1 Tax=Catenulispora acidiphila (strain DSM 44928 / JCM 14897 / NBRC 102108 / NRRL B-24433 / ID139908) TaxID=479433 RepID=C7QDU4_CATAD|nr:M55 family metallopeptidase [Catenulispora acidiphila]ACU74718.1 peptidase M55 D-aminopeptidase [Catenulispora acidiphila DSM 44928]
MRIFISADMEGITGLVDADDVQPGGRDYERGRLAMTGDVNAAVRGALRAGATEIVVNDAHGPMRNLMTDTLHPAARLIRGKPKTMGMIEGLTGAHDALICVGYHARAGAHGVLSHSFMGHEIEDMWLDDRATGEIGLVHAAAAALGVRLAALTGDDAACAEATAWDASIATAPVKYVRSRFAAELRPENEARAAIEDTILAVLNEMPADDGEHTSSDAVSDAESTLAVRWQSSAVAETLLGIPGVTAVDPRTVQAVGTPPDLFRQFGVWMRVASALTNQAPYC